MIRLRDLCKKDAVYMLEWMHDADIQACFQKSMASMTLQDAERFCENSAKSNKKDLISGDSLHYAIVDENDEYLGTISLKNLNFDAKNAEYAISVRKKAQGTGAAKEATELLIKKSVEEFGFHKIYLNVLSDNIRAIRFYEKCGFKYEGEARDHVVKNGRYMSLKWYCIISD